MPFMVRHQAAGLVPDYVFAAPPTAQQLAVVARVCASRCGERHLRSGEPFWLAVVEVPLVGDEDLPVPTLPEHGGMNAGMRAPGVDAVGRVVNPAR